MVSRESIVQVAGLLLAIAAFVGLSAAFPSGFEDPTVAGLLVLAFYAVAFGGPNLYLYLGDEGDAIPRSARGRFLVLIGVVLPLFGAGVVLQGQSLAGYGYRVIFGVLALLVFVGYFLNEARLGYADARSIADSR